MTTNTPPDKEYMKAVVRSAWEKYHTICDSQEESDYHSDSDKSYAQGYAEALSLTFYMFYNEKYDIGKEKSIRRFE
jgi:hypothetical protein